MKPEPVTIYLTEGQREQMQPLFDHARKKYDQGKAGVIVFQIYQWNDEAQT